MKIYCFGFSDFCLKDTKYFMKYLCTTNIENPTILCFNHFAFLYDNGYFTKGLLFDEF